MNFLRLLLVSVLIIVLVSQAEGWGRRRRRRGNFFSKVASKAKSVVKKTTKAVVKEANKVAKTAEVAVQSTVNKAKNVAKKAEVAVTSTVKKAVAKTKETAKKAVKGIKKGVAKATQLVNKAANTVKNILGPYFCRWCKSRQVGYIKPLFLFYPSSGRIAASITYNRVRYPGRRLRKFNKKYPTVFITHGFTSNGKKPESEFQELKNAYLKRVKKVNIFVVDWEKGASEKNYYQAVANTKVVGKSIATLIKYLVKYKRANLGTMHLIGHSLGAHVMGYAGREMRGRIGRITGLDPAGPGFENQDSSIRLDPTDAKFVDAMHTDAESSAKFGFGIRRRVGDVDFYIDNGNDQPNCPFRASGKLFWSVATAFGANFSTERMSCSHNRSTRLFISSLLLCKFPARKCKSDREARFKEGRCARIGRNKRMVQYMGFDAKPTVKPYLRGSFYVGTGTRKPNFCPSRRRG